MRTWTHLRDEGEEFTDIQKQITNKAMKGKNTTFDTRTCALFPLNKTPCKDVFNYKFYKFKINSSPVREIFNKDRCSADASVPVHFSSFELKDHSNSWLSFFPSQCSVSQRAAITRLRTRILTGFHLRPAVTLSHIPIYPIMDYMAEIHSADFHNDNSS